jgi:hypothetical protein
MTDIFWPPFNSDLDCPRCGGTGYARTRDGACKST